MITLAIINDILGNYQTELYVNGEKNIIKAIRYSPTDEPGYVYLTQEGDDVLCISNNGEIRVHDAKKEDIADLIGKCIHTLSEWRDGMNRLIFSGGILQDLVDISYPILRNPILIMDEQGIVIARTEHEKGIVDRTWDYILEHGEFPYDLVMEMHPDHNYIENHWLDTEQEPEIMEPISGYVPHHCICYHIPSFRHSIYVGDVLNILSENRYTPGVFDLFCFFTDAIRDWTTFKENDNPLATSYGLITNLLDGDNVPEDNPQFLALRQRYQADMYYLCAIPGKDKTGNHRLIYYFEHARCCSFEYHDMVLVIVPDSQIDDIKNNIRKMVKTTNLRAGISDSFTRFSSLKTILDLVMLALELSPEDICFTDSGIKLQYLLRAARHTVVNMKELMHPAIALLSDYDEKHGTDYLHTLAIWIRNERSVADSTRELHLHRNSMLYRLNRIQELTGEDFESYESRELVLLSLIMKDLI